jgi:hypothetical protein
LPVLTAAFCARIRDVVFYQIRFTEYLMGPAELSEKLWDNAERVAKYLLPRGHLEGKEWCAGNTNGDRQEPEN